MLRARSVHAPKKQSEKHFWRKKNSEKNDFQNQNFNNKKSEEKKIPKKNSLQIFLNTKISKK